MFAAFNVETDFPSWARMGEYAELWLRKAGSGAVIALIIWAFWFILKAALRDGKWVPYGITGRLDADGSENNWRARAFWMLLTATGIAFIAAVAYFFYQLMVENTLLDLFDVPSKDNRYRARTPTDLWFNLFFGLAILTLSIEFIFDILRFSPRRLIAIARFSIKEAIRRKVLWVFLILGLVVLFASWFITTDKKTDQWQQYINLVFYVVSTMVLVTAGILACFSLPTDIKQQTIFTVVTKPVQKLEIVLGRVLGLVTLMTLVLLAAGAISLVYVARGVDPEVAKSIRARNVEFGFLYFLDVTPTGEYVIKERGGDNIGRIWDYFQYLRGGSGQEAVWRFDGLASAIAAREKVWIEATFDIFRTSKGGEKLEQGVAIQYSFVNKSKWRGNFDEYRNARDPKTNLPLSTDEKARKFGYYELPKPTRAYDEGVTTREFFPGSIMADSPPDAVLEVHLNCRSSSQYLGTAHRNLYMLMDEGNWVWNFFKGIIGVWFFMVLVVVMGTVLSSYLNAPISLLVTVLLIIFGQPEILKYVQEQSLPDDPVNRPGGKAGEAMFRLMNQANMVAPLTASKGADIVMFLDNNVFRHVFKLVHAALPDLQIYDRRMFVSEGFDIPESELGATLLRLIMYCFPLLLLGYFLLSGREIAN